MYHVIHIALLVFYCLLFGYAIPRIPFLRDSGIRPRWLLFLFSLHVLTGWIHNIIAWRYFPEHGDIWNYFQLSFLYRHRLLHQFPLFLDDNSTWTYVSHNGIVYIDMLLNWLSFDSMYLNTLLFAFPVFLGNVALYRVFRRRFPDDRLAAGCVFWLPSALFWTGCIYREGVLYMLLGFFFYYVDRLFSRDRSRRALLYGCCCFLLIAYFRIAVAILLLPAVLLWWLSEHPRRRRLWIVGALAAGLMVLAFTVPSFYSPVLKAAASEQASFQLLEGHSRLPLPVLDSSFSSLWRVLPAAIVNGLFEPLPGSGGQAIYLAFSLELVFVWGVVVLSIVVSLMRIISPTYKRGVSGFAFCCLLFAISGMLLIGIMVPFAGTIVRYRSIYLPFLLAPCLYAIRNKL